MLKIKNKFSLFVLIFQSFSIGAILMALIAQARVGNTTWCIICGILGGLNTFLLITNIINNVKPYENNNLKFDVCVTPEIAAELEKLDRQVDEIMKDLPTYKPVSIDNFKED